MDHSKLKSMLSSESTPKLSNSKLKGNYSGSMRINNSPSQLLLVPSKELKILDEISGILRNENENKEEDICKVVSELISENEKLRRENDAFRLKVSFVNRKLESLEMEQTRNLSELKEISNLMKFRNNQFLQNNQILLNSVECIENIKTSNREILLKSIKEMTLQVNFQITQLSKFISKSPDIESLTNLLSSRIRYFKTKKNSLKKKFDKEKAKSTELFSINETQMIHYDKIISEKDKLLAKSNFNLKTKDKIWKSHKKRMNMIFTKILKFLSFLSKGNNKALEFLNEMNHSTSLITKKNSFHHCKRHKNIFLLAENIISINRSLDSLVFRSHNLFNFIETGFQSDNLKKNDLSNHTKSSNNLLLLNKRKSGLIESVLEDVEEHNSNPTYENNRYGNITGDFGEGSLLKESDSKDAKNYQKLTQLKIEKKMLMDEIDKLNNENSKLRSLNDDSQKMMASFYSSPGNWQMMSNLSKFQSLDKSRDSVGTARSKDETRMSYQRILKLSSSQAALNSTMGVFSSLDKSASLMGSGRKKGFP